MTAVVTMVALVVVFIVTVVFAMRAGPGGTPRVLRWGALAIAVVAAVVLTPYTVGDSGGAAAFLLGVPVVVAAIPVTIDLLVGRGVLLASWVGAVAVAIWGLLLALGIGAAFLPAALLLIAAAAAEAGRRRSSGGSGARPV